jgi:hypothetical protein
MHRSGAASHLHISELVKQLFPQSEGRFGTVAVVVAAVVVAVVCFTALVVLFKR